MWLIIFMSNNFILSFLELFENEHVRIGQKGKLLIIFIMIYFDYIYYNF